MKALYAVDAAAQCLVSINSSSVKQLVVQRSAPASEANSELDTFIFEIFQ